MSKKSDNQESSGEVPFEQALAQLDAIVQDLEEGQIPLADGLGRYEQGIKLLRHCYQLLDRVERRIVVLNRVDSDGTAVTATFDDEALSLEEKAPARGRRRSGTGESNSPSPRNEIDDAPRLF